VQLKDQLVLKEHKVLMVQAELLDLQELLVQAELQELLVQAELLAALELRVRVERLDLQELLVYLV
jgi:hypothetical protein